MAGHSHWANIKHKKGRTDAKRAKVWGKIAKKIMVAAKGGSDPRDNLSLRYVIDEARAVNMPKGTIENAVAKGAGELEGQAFEEVVYEGYGPAGVAVLVDVLTDNRNRIAPELRTIFGRSGGSLGTSGSVAFQFDKQGIFTVPSAAMAEDDLLEKALEAGAGDVQDEGEVFVVSCPAAAYAQVKDALEAAGVPLESSQLASVPQNTISLDAETGRRVLNLIDALEDNDDVQSVSHNGDIPSEAHDA